KEPNRSESLTFRLDSTRLAFILRKFRRARAISNSTLGRCLLRCELVTLLREAYRYWATFGLPFLYLASTHMTLKQRQFLLLSRRQIESMADHLLHLVSLKVIIGLVRRNPTHDSIVISS